SVPHAGRDGRARAAVGRMRCGGRGVSKFSLTLSLARKDWRLFWADRRAALMCFVVPVVLASAFGLIFHRPPTEVAKLHVVVVVEDEGPFTRQVADELL